MKFDGAVLDIIQTFSVPEIVRSQCINSRFHQFTNLDKFFEILKKSYKKKEERVFNVYFKNVGALHFSPNNPWNLILKRWYELCIDNDVSFIPPVPLRVVSSHSIKVSFEEANSKSNDLYGKMIVDWYVPFVFIIRMHLNITIPIHHHKLISLMREENIKVRYKSKEFSSFKELAVFIKANILSSLFKTKSTPSNFHVSLSDQNFYLMLKSNKSLSEDDRKYLVALLLRRKNIKTIPEETINKLFDNSLRINDEEYILTTRNSVLIYSPLLYTSISKCARKSFRRKTIYGFITALFLKEFLSKLNVFAKNVIIYKVSYLGYLLMNLAVSCNPYFLVGEKAIVEPLLDPLPLRKVFKKVVALNSLFDGYTTVIKSFLNVAKDVKLPNYVLALQDSNKLQPPVFIEFYEPIYSALLESFPLKILIEKLSKTIGLKAAKLVEYLVDALSEDLPKSKAVSSLLGCRTISTILAEFKSKTGENITKKDLYGDEGKGKLGILAVLESMGIIIKRKEKIFHPPGHAVFVCLNIKNPMVQLIISGLKENEKKRQKEKISNSC